MIKIEGYVGKRVSFNQLLLTLCLNDIVVRLARSAIWDNKQEMKNIKPKEIIFLSIPVFIIAALPSYFANRAAVHKAWQGAIIGKWRDLYDGSRTLDFHPDGQLIITTKRGKKFQKEIQKFQFANDNYILFFEKVKGSWSNTNVEQALKISANKLILTNGDIDRYGSYHSCGRKCAEVYKRVE